MTYRTLSKGVIWRRVERKATLELPELQRKAVDEVAEVLAAISHVPMSLVSKRIVPKTAEDLQDITELRNSLSTIDSKQPLDPVSFTKIFLRFEPANFQSELLRSPDRRIVLRWSRQSGKTITFAAKAIHYCVTHPRALVMIVAPKLDQSMITAERLAVHLANMPKCVNRAWINEHLKTVVRFANGSTIRATPYSLHRLRGETCDLIFVDEAAFIREDQVLFQSVLEPMFATRKEWQMIVSSTPWGKDSMFWKFCKDPQIGKLWRQFHIPWREALEPKGPITKEFMDERLQEVEAGVLPVQDFQREYEAEFAEDVDTWLTQDLITKCIDPRVQYRKEGEIYWKFEDEYHDKELFGGLDLGKRIDYSAVAVFEKLGEELFLRHAHVFPLDTEYTAVIGYVKVLSQRWRYIVKWCVDTTNAEYFGEDMKNSGVPNVDGVFISAPKKEEIMIHLRQKMGELTKTRIEGRDLEVSRVHIPYDPRVISQLNIERYELSKDGHIRFSHPTGTHDDLLIAFALAVWASRAPSGVFTMKGVPKTLA